MELIANSQWGGAVHYKAWAIQALTKILATLPDNQSKFDVVQEQLSFLAGKKIDEEDSEDEYTPNPDDDEEMQLDEMIRVDHDKMFVKFFHLISTYINKKQDFDENNMAIGNDAMADLMNKVEEGKAAVDEAFKVLQDMGLEHYDSENGVSKAMKKVTERKIDFTWITKSKNLSLQKNFKDQQTKVLDKLDSAFTTFKGDLLEPYKSTERMVEVINTVRADSTRDYVWRTKKGSL